MTSNSDDQSIDGAQPRVLVGVDGSEDGLRAVRYGARTVLRRGGVLHLVHAVDDAALAGAWGVVYDTSSLQEAGQAAIDEALAVAQDEGLPGEQVTDEVVLGNGASVLVQKSKDVDLLVVGRRAASGLERMFVGSTSVAVADAAQCPVIVVSAASMPAATGDRQAIGVGIGVQNHSEHTLEFAAAEAERRGAALHVIHVTGPDQAKAARGDLAEAARTGIDRLLTGVRERHPGVPVEVAVTRGQPLDELVGRSAGLDLMVVGVKKPKFIAIHLGGVMRGLLAHSQCPVLLVK